MVVVVVVVVVPETTVIKLVVRSERGERASADAVRKEDLRGGVDPGLAVAHVRPVDLEESQRKWETEVD